MNTPRTLDWKGSYDEKSRNFRAVAGIEELPLRNKAWRCDYVLDQGQEGACVGFGWSGELGARPKVVDVNNQFAFDLYNRAKELDNWPGEDYEGTSVLAGAKAVMEHTNSAGQPLISGYHWAFGVEDVLRTVSYRGPVVLGITWYTNMYQPDADNYIHASGTIAGGHCILLNGQKLVAKDLTQPLTFDNVDPVKSRVRLHNSWGSDWGNNGEAYLSVGDLNVLLHDQGGEACIPTGRRLNV